MITIIINIVLVAVICYFPPELCQWLAFNFYYFLNPTLTGCILNEYIYMHLCCTYIHQVVRTEKTTMWYCDIVWSLKWSYTATNCACSLLSVVYCLQQNVRWKRFLKVFVEIYFLFVIIIIIIITLLIFFIFLLTPTSTIYL